MSHFQYVYAFPRAAARPGFEEKLFVPYHNLFKDLNDRADQATKQRIDRRLRQSQSQRRPADEETLADQFRNMVVSSTIEPSRGYVLHAKVIKIHQHSLELDRSVSLTYYPDGTTTIPFDYLIHGCGTCIPTPGHLEDSSYASKQASITHITAWQESIYKAERILIAGGGAVGLELAGEIKDRYPGKSATLIHSRKRYLLSYKASLHDMVFNILDRLGVRQILGDRCIIPANGFPKDPQPQVVRTKEGRTIEADLVIPCIGMKPNSNLLRTLTDTVGNDIPHPLYTPSNFITTLPSLQIAHSAFPHIFAARGVTANERPEPSADFPYPDYEPGHYDPKKGHNGWHQSIWAHKNYPSYDQWTKVGILPNNGDNTAN